MESTSQLRGKRCAILGAGGFIGRSLSAALVECGADVRACRISGEPGTVPGTSWHRADFASASSLTAAVADAEIVVHCAGRMTPETSNQRPLQDIEENLLGSVRLLECCIDAKVKKLVFASSGGTVYGPGALTPAAETDATEPISSYGIVKLAYEKYLALYRRSRGLDSVSLRISNVYGRGQEPGARGIVALALSKAVAGEPIAIWGDGSVVRDFVHIDDVVDAIMRSMLLDLPDAPRVYNIGSGVGRSVREVLATIEAIYGRPLTIAYLPGKAADVPYSVLDVRLARQFLGWTPQRAWHEGVQDAYDWLQEELRAPARTPAKRPRQG
ncbi:MAG TPA: NAD-dependent epimerase/dehydratase family protein [Alphaproteobacteria bacterium]